MHKYMVRVRDNIWYDMGNCDNEEFLDLEDELWAKMYQKQAPVVEAQERIHIEETLVSIDGGLPTTDRDK